MDMFLKLSPWNSSIDVACIGLLDMFFKLWVWNFNVVEIDSSLLVLWVLLKCFYFGFSFSVPKSCSPLELVSMVTICIPHIKSSKGNNLVIRHPLICCLTHVRCLAYCWTQVVHLRLAPMYLCGFVCKLAWKF